MPLFLTAKISVINKRMLINDGIVIIYNEKNYIFSWKKLQDKLGKIFNNLIYVNSNNCTYYAFYVHDRLEKLTITHPSVY